MTNIKHRSESETHVDVNWNPWPLLLGLLTLIFVLLKLTHVISWSWWWVLSPVIVPVGFVLLIFVLTLIVYISMMVWRGGRS